MNAPQTGDGRPWLKRVLDMPNDSREKTIFIALALCLVCSILVSVSAVVLKPLQRANESLDLKRNLLLAAALVDKDASKQAVEEAFERVDVRVIDLRTGEFVADVDVTEFNQRRATADPATSERIASEDDVAGVKRRPHFANVYLVKEGDTVTQVILPVSGYGLWSTLYGFLALEPDLRTISGLKFYEHAETAGLGAEVDNPGWLAQWKGKEAFDESGQTVIAVVKGSAGDSNTQVDGLAGATLTSRGVHNMLQYWLGEQGFGPFLDKYRGAQIANTEASTMGGAG